MFTGREALFSIEQADQSQPAPDEGRDAALSSAIKKRRACGERRPKVSGSSPAYPLDAIVRDQ